MTATRKKAGPKKPETKPTAAAQPTAGKSKKKVVASVKTAATKPSIPVLVVPTNPLEEISDLLDRLPLQACVELTRRLLTSISSLPTGTGPPGLSWKPSFASWPNMAARPRRTVGGKALRLTCWNADGVLGRKIQLEYFLSQHGVDICL